MIARALSRRGLHLGEDDQLIGPDNGNPLGHFEHAEFHRINDKLLAHFGGSWDNPPELKPGWEHDSSLHQFVDEAKRLVETFAGIPLWGWKDPRSALLLRFWMSVIPNLRFVVCSRSPLDVARSLEKRDGMSIGAGASLWYRYFRAAVRDTEGFPRIFTFYEDYFEDALSEIDRVSEFCGLSRCENISQSRDSVSRALRHHATDTADLLNAKAIPAQYKLFYLCLRTLSGQELSRLRSSRRGLDTTSKSVGKILDLIIEIEDQEKVARLQSLLAKKEQEFAAVHSATRKQLNDLEKQLSDLLQQNLRLQAFSDAVRSTFVYRFYKACIKPLGINFK